MINKLDTAKEEIPDDSILCESEKHLQLFCSITRKSNELKNCRTLEPNIQKAVDNTTTVKAGMIARRLNEAELHTAITINQDKFAKYMPTICHKSGKQLVDRYTLQNLTKLVTIHGEERALTIIMLTYTHSTCPEWYYTDPQGLTALSKADPIGYCVEALGLIMRPYWSTKFKHSNLSSEEKCQIIADKYQANCNLKSIPIKTIIELNEIMRRFLGICKPEFAVEFLGMACSTMQTMTNSVEAIKQLQSSICSALKNIIINHAKQTKRNRMNAALMADIKAELHGMSTYYQQLKLGAVTSHEANVLDLRGFFAETSNIRIQSLAKQSQMLVEKQPEFKTLDTSKPLQLKVKQPEALNGSLSSATNAKANAFTNMFAAKKEKF